MKAGLLILALLSMLVIWGCGGGRRTSDSPAGQAGQVVEADWKSYEEGLAEARESGKPILVKVFATWCAPCKILEEQVFQNPTVVEASADFVMVKVDGDKEPELRAKLNVTSYPTVVFLSPEEEELSRSLGAVPYESMLELMKQVQGKIAG